MKAKPWPGRVAKKKPGFKEKKRTKKEEAAFQKQLAIDRRNSAIHYRSNLVRDAEFLINQAQHRLQDAIQYFDCSQHPDFDDLHHNLYSAQHFIEFVMEKLEEIRDRDYEFGVHPTQRYEQVKEKENGRRKRSRSRKIKKRSQSC